MMPKPKPKSIRQARIPDNVILKELAILIQNGDIENFKGRLAQLQRGIINRTFGKRGYTLLHVAAENRNPEFVRQLLAIEGINPDLNLSKKQYSVITPLIIAHMADNKECVRTILHSESFPNAESPSFPLIITLVCNLVDEFERLIERKGYEVDKNLLITIAALSHSNDRFYKLPVIQKLIAEKELLDQLEIYTVAGEKEKVSAIITKIIDNTAVKEISSLIKVYITKIYDHLCTFMVKPKIQGLGFSSVVMFSRNLYKPELEHSTYKVVNYVVDTFSEIIKGNINQKEIEREFEKIFDDFNNHIFLRAIPDEVCTQNIDSLKNIILPKIVANIVSNEEYDFDKLLKLFNFMLRLVKINTEGLQYQESEKIDNLIVEISQIIKNYTGKSQHEMYHKTLHPMKVLYDVLRCSGKSADLSIDQIEREYRENEKRLSVENLDLSDPIVQQILNFDSRSPKINVEIVSEKLHEIRIILSMVDDVRNKILVVDELLTKINGVVNELDTELLNRTSLKLSYIKEHSYTFADKDHSNTDSKVTSRDIAIRFLNKLRAELAETSHEDVDIEHDLSNDESGQLVEPRQVNNIFDFLAQNLGIEQQDFGTDKERSAFEKTFTWYPESYNGFFNDYSFLLRDLLSGTQYLGGGQTHVLLTEKINKKNGNVTIVFNIDLLNTYLGQEETANAELLGKIRTMGRKYPLNHVKSIIDYLLKARVTQIKKANEAAKEEQKQNCLKPKILNKLSEYFIVDNLDGDIVLDRLVRVLLDYKGTYNNFFLIYHDHISNPGHSLMQTTLETVDGCSLDKEIIDLITVCKLKAAHKNQKVGAAAAVQSHHELLHGKLQRLKLFVQHVSGLKMRKRNSVDVLLEILRSDHPEHQQLDEMVISTMSHYSYGDLTGHFTNITQDIVQDERAGLKRDLENMQMELEQLFPELRISPEGLQFNIHHELLTEYFGHENVQAIGQSYNDDEKLYLLSRSFESDFIRRRDRRNIQTVEQKLETKPGLTFAETVWSEGIKFIKIKFILQEALSLASEDHDYTLINAITVHSNNQHVNLSLEQLKKICDFFYSSRYFKIRIGSLPELESEENNEIILRLQLLELLSEELFTEVQRVRFTCGVGRCFAEDKLMKQLAEVSNGSGSTCVLSPVLLISPIKSRSHQDVEASLRRVSTPVYDSNGVKPALVPWLCGSSAKLS